MLTEKANKLRAELSAILKRAVEIDAELNPAYSFEVWFPTSSDGDVTTLADAITRAITAMQQPEKYIKVLIKHIPTGRTILSFDISAE